MSETRLSSPAEIERASMRIIRRELIDRGMELGRQNEAVLLRVIHTTADFDYVQNMTFTPDAVAQGIAALKAGAAIVTDTNMASAGISKPALAKVGGTLHCYMAQESVVSAAKAQGITRAAASMRFAAGRHPDAVFAVGNAPTALFELCELIAQGLRPALVIGVPVGFVNVTESKTQLLCVCQRYGIPAIIAMGRKGGSNVAAAICNALLYCATDTLDPAKR